MKEQQEKQKILKASKTIFFKLFFYLSDISI